MSVYFIESGPYMKIGFSDDPISRNGTVTRNGKRPDDLPFDHETDLIGWIPGDREVEAQLHKQFAHLRVAGEWFWSERDAATELIWNDPCGVDLHRMSALAVLAMRRHPTATRADIENVGVAVLATPLDEALDSIFGEAS